MNYSPTNKHKDLEKNDNTEEKYIPLIEKMRPNQLSQYIGQSHLIGPKTVLYNLVKTGMIQSMILWGPPGSGKTSLVNVMIHENKKLSEYPIKFIELSASMASINDIREAVREAEIQSKQNISTVIFMDEIHKFNKLQQDIFLPYIEAGTFILIGATTENPSSLNSALLSRCRVFVLKKLQKDDLVSIVSKAIKLIGGEIILKNKKVKDKNFRTAFFVQHEVVEWLAEVCDGDGRVALNGLEMAVQAKLSSTYKNKKTININDIKYCLTTIQASNNKKCNNLYQMHFALHHCIIADDDNAALYWLTRIMETGEDPVYIARKLVNIASEDIEFDDEDALSIAVHTMEACQMIGMPECDVLLAQCVIYLSRAEKSKELQNALIKSRSVIENHKGPQPKVPLFMTDKSRKETSGITIGSNYENSECQENLGRSLLPKSLENIKFFND